jgi:ribosomal protein S13
MVHSTSPNLGKARKRRGSSAAFPARTRSPDLATELRINIHGVGPATSQRAVQALGYSRRVPVRVEDLEEEEFLTQVYEQVHKFAPITDDELRRSTRNSLRRVI